jgi:1-acyl-sn-glycerol-3-phosphate acyltransferase
LKVGATTTGLNICPDSSPIFFCATALREISNGSLRLNLGLYSDLMARLSPIFYRLCWLGGRFTFLCTMNLRVLRLETAERQGPYVLAITHLSHLEPFLVTTAMWRKIDFIARIEFYRHRVLAWMLRKLNAIKVNRQGVAANTVRTALDRLKMGRIVGIFPEGGVSRGTSSVCLGGPIKLGVALIACRAGVPVVPCVVVGTHELNQVKPWLPFKRAHVWMAFGDPIAPIDPGTTRASRKAAYAAVGGQLQQSMMQLYQELCQTYALQNMAGETFAEPATASRPTDVRNADNQSDMQESSAA